MLNNDRKQNRRYLDMRILTCGFGFQPSQGSYPGDTIYCHQK
ncbi:hypothetical protein Thiosp_01186 [Thiorhodovibrio litoralis]|nr:hypothetical protein Thiosp_01186 [Thiorhodovibrio litoralis]